MVRFWIYSADRDVGIYGGIKYKVSEKRMENDFKVFILTTQRMELSVTEW